MKELLPKLVIGPNHPLRTGYLVTSIGPRPQAGKSATMPEKKVIPSGEDEGVKQQGGPQGLSPATLLICRRLIAHD